MVLLTMTASIVEALKHLDETSSLELSQSLQDQTGNPDAKTPPLREPTIGKPISHAQVIDLWKRVKSRDSDTIRLEDLLRGSTVYMPPPPPKPQQTDEYKALMARLRREEEERSYERMLKKAPHQEPFAERYPSAPLARSFAEVNKPSKQSDLGDDTIEFGEVQKQVTLIINFLVSIVGCGAALWMASSWWSVPARLFLSLGGSIAVAIAEVAVYSLFTFRMTEGEKRETKKKEVKEIMKTWVIGEESEKLAPDDIPTLIEKKSPVDLHLRKRFNPSS
ncbi:endoplasmic reticulum-based factor for assembly of V-ATPase-domain-containing protein [Xylariomycetidae sp. FL2044]|nr:endoplasmic reticulum-based factor for assembly of V-ATPase-domain-containing protein [Xylariomycetidae sp. FL2044]